jgi:hypothetical protein
MYQGTHAIGVLHLMTTYCQLIHSVWLLQPGLWYSVVNGIRYQEQKYLDVVAATIDLLLLPV